MYKETWLEKYGLKLLNWFLIALTVFITIVIYASIQHHGRVYNQCLQDGKKEYECYAMIYGSRR